MLKRTNPGVVAADCEILSGRLPVFLDNAPTPLDLRFRLLGFSVRVSPWFWLTMFILGGDTYNDREYGLLASLVWIVCGFVSILAHELGHAIAAGWFRSRGRIVLVPFGGAMEYLDGPPPSGWRRLTVSLMGPGAGFAFLLVLIVTQLSTGWATQHSMLTLIFFYLVVQNFYWSLLNLIPVWPLDGGYAMREIFHILGVRKPDHLAHTVSIAVAAVLVVMGILGRGNPNHPLLPQIPAIDVVSLLVLGRLQLGLVPFIPGVFMMIWMGLMGFRNWQVLQSLNRTQRTWDDDRDDDNPPWLRGRR